MTTFQPQLCPQVPSVDAKSNWIMVREIIFPELTKLSYLPGKPEDL